MATERRPHVILGLTASVATVKWTELAKALHEFADVRIVRTEHAKHFFDLSASYNPTVWSAYHSSPACAAISVLDDADEWKYASVGADPVLHIELRKWADLLLIAPLSANSMAKLAHGLSDNLLTSIARAWPMPLCACTASCSCGVARSMALASALLKRVLRCLQHHLYQYALARVGVGSRC